MYFHYLEIGRQLQDMKHVVHTRPIVGQGFPYPTIMMVKKLIKIENIMEKLISLPVVFYTEQPQRQVCTRRKIAASLK